MGRARAKRKREGVVSGVHKLDGIGIGRIRTFPLLSDSAYDPVKTKLSESQAEAEEQTNRNASSQAH